MVTGKSFWLSKYLLYCLDNSQATTDTMLALDMYLTWSFLELQTGTFLDVDPWNFRLPHRASKGVIADGWKGILVCHKGDEKYIQRTYQTSHSAVSKNVCIHCHASNEEGPLLYTQHGWNAFHRTTLLSTPDFIHKVQGSGTFVWLPGWHIGTLCLDWLHLVDLTVIPETAASCLVELAAEGCFGHASTADERLRLGFISFTKWCKEAKIRNRGQVFCTPLSCDCFDNCFFGVLQSQLFVVFFCNLDVFQFVVCLCLFVVIAQETIVCCRAQIIPNSGAETFQWCRSLWLERKNKIEIT